MSKGDLQSQSQPERRRLIGRHSTISRRSRRHFPYLSGEVWQCLPRSTIRLPVLIGLICFFTGTSRLAISVLRESRAIGRAEKLGAFFLTEDMWPQWSTRLLATIRVPPPRRLTYLSLHNSDEADWIAQSLAGCEGLRRLELSRTDASDLAMDSISSIPNLKELDLSETAVTDTGLQHLSRLKSLEDLNLGETSAADGSALAIAQLSSLKLLWLENTNITDVGLARIASCKSLWYLNLRGTMVGDNGVQAICRDVPIAYLTLEDTNISSDSVEALSKTSTMVRLIVGSTQLDACDVAKLRKHLPKNSVCANGLPCLEFCQLTRSGEITPESFRQAFRSMPPPALPATGPPK